MIFMSVSTIGCIPEAMKNHAEICESLKLYKKNKKLKQQFLRNGYLFRSSPVLLKKDPAPVHIMSSYRITNNTKLILLKNKFTKKFMQK